MTNYEHLVETGKLIEFLWLVEAEDDGALWKKYGMTVNLNEKIYAVAAEWLQAEYKPKEKEYVSVDELRRFFADTTVHVYRTPGDPIPVHFLDADTIIALLPVVTEDEIKGSEA